MITEMLKKYGQDLTRAFLLDLFEKPENLVLFPSLFPDHVGADLPGFQIEMLHDIPVFRRYAVLAPRGAGKSTIVTVPVIAWHMLFGKSRFTVLVSDTLPQARLHLEALKNELENNDFLNFLFGDVRGEIWGSDMLIVRTRYGESAIVAKGKGQKIRGLKFRSFRPELVVLDDFENEDATQSAEQREKDDRWFRFNLLRGLSKKRNKVIMIGTAVHEQALICRIVKKLDPKFEAWETRHYKAIRDDNTSFWEAQFPLQYLIAIRDDPTHPDFAGELVFAKEMQNEPRSEGDQIIRPHWIDEYSANDFDHDWKTKLKMVGMVDPAISKNAKSSDFVMHTFGIDSDGHKWHINTVRGKFSIQDQAKIILDEYDTYRHSEIGIEAVAYQQALGQVVKAEGAKRIGGLYPKITEVFTQKDKAVKMVSVSPQFQGGFVHLLREHKETPILREQLVNFPAGKNDSADTLAMLLELTTKKRTRAFAKKPTAF